MLNLSRVGQILFWQIFWFSYSEGQEYKFFVVLFLVFINNNLMFQMSECVFLICFWLKLLLIYRVFSISYTLPLVLLSTHPSHIHTKNTQSPPVLPHARTHRHTHSKPTTPLRGFYYISHLKYISALMVSTRGKGSPTGVPLTSSSRLELLT